MYLNFSYQQNSGMGTPPDGTGLLQQNDLTNGTGSYNQVRNLFIFKSNLEKNKKNGFLIYCYVLFLDAECWPN